MLDLHSTTQVVSRVACDSFWQKSSSLNRRLHAAICRVRFVFWRIKITADATSFIAKFEIQFTHDYSITHVRILIVHDKSQHVNVPKACFSFATLRGWSLIRFCQGEKTSDLLLPILYLD